MQIKKKKRNDWKECQEVTELCQEVTFCYQKIAFCPLHDLYFFKGSRKSRVAIFKKIKKSLV